MKEQKTFLFIGGCADGQRIRHDIYPGVIAVPDIPIPKAVFVGMDEPVPTQEIRVDHYRPVPFAAGSYRESIYVLEGISASEALAMLISGYRAPTPTPRT